MSRSFGSERLLPMKNPTQHLIAEVPRSSSKVGMTIGIDLGDVWSHYCTLNEDGEVVGRGRFRTSPSGVVPLPYFTDRGFDLITLPVCPHWRIDAHLLGVFLVQCRRAGYICSSGGDIRFWGIGRIRC